MALRTSSRLGTERLAFQDASVVIDLVDPPSSSPSCADAPPWQDTVMRSVSRVSVEAVVALPERSVGPLHGLVAAVEHELAILPAGALVPHARELLDAWLTRSDLTCCACMTAIEVTLDGRSWTELALDHFWHQGGWVHLAIGAIADGASSAFVWNESSLVAHREGDRLVLSDARWETFQRPFAWHPVSVPLRPFVEALVGACIELDELRRAIAGECATRSVDAARANDLLAGLGDRPRPAQGDLPRRLAVVAREMERGELRDLPRLRELVVQL